VKAHPEASIEMEVNYGYSARTETQYINELQIQPRLPRKPQRFSERATLLFRIPHLQKHIIRITDAGVFSPPSSIACAPEGPPSTRTASHTWPTTPRLYGRACVLGVVTDEVGVAFEYQCQ
jgi:hypothetical protein